MRCYGHLLNNTLYPHLMLSPGPLVAVHAEIAPDCFACHSQQAWKPATFEHDKLFLLDKDHSAPCETCHSNNDYRRYNCYGCHEHSLDKTRSEHQEEGIQNFENCVEYHRSAKGEPENRGSGKEKGKRRNKEHD